MTDETEAPEEEQKVEEAPPEVSDSEPEKEEKKGPVDLSPEQQRLFNREFRARKDLERAVGDLRDLNAALFAKVEEMDVARASDHRQATEAQLTEQITKATQRGDWARVSQLQGQLIDLKAEAKARDVMAKAQPKKEQPKQQVDHEMVEILREWADELDENMNFKRPYAQPGHPMQKKAAALGQALMEDPKFGGNMPKILAELDRQMTGGTSRTPAVLPSNTKPAQTGVKLTPEQIEVAKRMGVSPEKYAKQLEIIGR